MKMKGRRSIFFLLFFLVFLGVGCYFFYQKDQSRYQVVECLISSEVSQSWEQSAQVLNDSSSVSEQLSMGAEKSQTRSVFSGIQVADLVNKKLSKGDSEQYLLEQLPTCKTPSLKSLEIIVLDEVVKNCRTQEKKGQYPDGLGRACTSVYRYDPELGEIYDLNNCYAPLFSGDRGYEENLDDVYLCKDYYKGEEEPVLAQRILNQNASRDFHKQVYVWGYSFKALRRALKNGYLLSSYGVSISVPALYCLENDPDCDLLLDIGSWADDQGNYFAAGTRTLWSFSAKIFYAINDKVYDPGEESNPLEIEKNPYSSRWLFGGFQNRKLLVKKIKNLTYTPVQNMNPYPATYTLETCEVEL